MTAKCKNTKSISKLLIITADYAANDSSQGWRRSRALVSSLFSSVGFVIDIYAPGEQDVQTSVIVYSNMNSSGRIVRAGRRDWKSRRRTHAEQTEPFFPALLFAGRSCTTAFFANVNTIANISDERSTASITSAPSKHRKNSARDAHLPSGNKTIEYFWECKQIQQCLFTHHLVSPQLIRLTVF